MELRSDLLAGMYRLPHRGVAHSQNEPDCLKYLALLKQVLEPLWAVPLSSPESRPEWCTEKDLGRIHNCKPAFDLPHAQTGGPIHWLQWLPKYGSMVIAHSLGDLRFVGTVSLVVLGLDPHQFSMHASQPGTSNHYDFLGRPTDFTTLPVKTVLVTEMPRIQAAFQNALTVAQKRKGDHRSAGHNKQGHQYTPAMIYALLKQSALQGQVQGGVDQSPPGGFTDCGVHTGGHARNTSFPLVRSWLHWWMKRTDDSNSTTFRKVMLWMDLWIIKAGLEDVESRMPGRENWIKGQHGILRMDIDCAHAILVEATLKFEPLCVKLGASVPSFLHQAASLERKIKDCIERLQDDEATAYTFGNIDQELLAPNAFRNPILKLSPTSSWDTAKNNPDDFESLTLKNIGLFEVYDLQEDFDWITLLEWIKKLALRASHQLDIAWHVVRTVEECFWIRAETDDGLNVRFSSSAECNAVYEIILEYRKIVYNLHSVLDKSHPRKTELYSREVLVTWVGYCIVFSNIQASYSCLSSTGVCLHYQDLEHLVLSDKRLWIVLRQVKMFLHEHYIVKKELFSLRFPEATFAAGERFADLHQREIYDSERRDADKRVDNHWALIQQMQDKLHKLRSNLYTFQDEKGRLETSLAEARRTYNNSRHEVCVPNGYDGHWHVRYEYSKSAKYAMNVEEKRLSNKNAKIKETENAIVRAKKAPQAVFQPLPDDKSLALQWIFFLHMPNDLRVLLSLSFTAQQTLAPRLSDLSKSGVLFNDVAGQFMITEVKSSFPNESITQYYNSRKTERLYITNPCSFVGADGQVKLRGTTARIKPSAIMDVDEINRSSDNVFYPDVWKPRMAWTGGSCAVDCPGFEFDPFCISRKTSVAYFTEQLHADARVIQWMMVQDGSRSATRGNTPIATQDLKLRWLDKTAYLTLGKLRSYPFGQLRNLLSAFKDNSLPLDKLSIQQMIYQLVYHIGKVTENPEESASFLWKFDLYTNGFISSVHKMLNAIAARLCETPTAYSECAFISELASFFLSWDENGSHGNVGLLLAQSLCEWAESHAKDLNRSENHAIKYQAQLKQIIYFRNAILCLTSAPWQVMNDASSPSLPTEVIEEIIAMTVVTQNMVLDDIISDEAQKLEIRCVERLHSWANALLKVVSGKQAILTNAIRRFVPQCPECLSWEEISTSTAKKTACFRAYANGSVYAINILSGVVLVNGFPPSKLPMDIRQAKLYLDGFGCNNFDVVRSPAGVFETINPVEGKNYHFKYSCNKSLLVREIDVADTSVLELLDHRHIDTWGKELPRRLKEMHHFWVTQDRSAVLVRGKSFKDRSVSFVMTLNRRSKEENAVEARLHLIPKSLEIDTVCSYSACNLLQCDTLVVMSPASRAISILQKFEHRDFIHAVVGANGKIRFEMPRYSLSFENQNSALAVREFKGFYLTSDQLLKGTLHGYDRYLVMERGECRFKEISLIVPDGEVVHDTSSGCTLVRDTSCDCDALLEFHKLPIHSRYRTIHGNNTVSMLRLASLHASTTIGIPDMLFGMTGFERSMDLIRQSFTSSPLTKEELLALENVASLCKGRSPSLRLACLHLFRSSQLCSFLHQDVRREVLQPDVLSFEDDCNDSILCSLSDYTRYMNCRMSLTNEETGYCSGTEYGLDYHIPATSVISIEWTCMEIAGGRAGAFERSLCELLVDHDTSKGREINDEFPLINPADATRLERSVFDELLGSWNSFQSSRMPNAVLINDAVQRIHELSNDINKDRISLELWLVSALDAKISSPLLSADVLKFRKIAGLVPLVCRSDFTRILYDHTWLPKINPLLSADCQRKLIQGLYVWHRLCVLEDKVQRLQSSSRSNICNELQVSRCWDVDQFPCWLAFEVEQCLQIRPEQAVVAKHLIEHPGDIVQLNMGLGKTRVIIPMLVLHWTRETQCYTTRLNVLPNLFHENIDYFQSALTASISRTRIFVLPFCRDVIIDKLRVGAMEMLLKQCQQSRGLFVTTPEHRLSLELKIHELRRAGQVKLSDLLRDSIHDSHERWRDVVDESDELLHHRFRLIYATGAAEKLPQAEHRYRMPQFLLHKLCSCEKLRDWIRWNPEIALLEGSCSCESFPPLRLNAKTLTQKKSYELQNLLFDSVTSQPPYELDWMLNHPLHFKIRQFVIDLNASTDSVASLTEAHLHDLFILRGLLAGNLLFDCLQKRHRVDFGINYDADRRIAIPFRAADVPAPRSEFAHPDCAIIFTCRSYYCDGLNQIQIVECFTLLLSLGPESQRKQYKSWFQLSKPNMNKDDSRRLDCIDKIDLTNKKQLEKLMMYYRRNVETINFWLQWIVFPSEMQHFPTRMTTTSWNLAENADRQIVGFSGTNDNHRILPRQVTQFFMKSRAGSLNEVEIEEWIKMNGTNGMMIASILDHTVDCTCLHLKSDETLSTGLLTTVAAKCRDFDVGAIIDAGAMFAGIPNRDAAQQIVKTLSTFSHRFRGVTFFDNATMKWSILEMDTNRILPIERSSVEQGESFAFFDQPRCRGADLKLHPTTVAVLTLGPKMSKDKLMQAAGRLRKLGNEQKLIIIGSSEVMIQVTRFVSNSTSLRKRVRAALESTLDNAQSKLKFLREQVKAVLDWTLANTVEANGLGMLPWATQGFFHTSSHGDADMIIEPELASLRDLYGSPFKSVSARLAGESKRFHYTNRFTKMKGRSMDVRRLRTMNEILSTIEDFGDMMLRSTSGVDEECERELEVQRETETEQEKQIPRMAAVTEVDWELSAAFTKDDPVNLPSIVRVMSLQTFVESMLTPASLGSISWSDKVYVTGNFRNTVCSDLKQCLKPINQYLRIVDAGLFFSETGKILLLSERECDLAIEYLLMHPDPDPRCTVLFHLNLSGSSHINHGSSYHQKRITSIQKRITSILQSSASTTIPASLHVGRMIPGLDNDDRLLTCLHLFAGNTTFSTASQKAALQAMLQSQVYHPTSSLIDNHQHNNAVVVNHAHAEPEHLVTMRGRSHCFAYSDLEEVCKAVAKNCEASQLLLVSRT